MRATSLLAIDQQSSVHTSNKFLVRPYTPYGYQGAHSRALLAFAGEASALLPHCYLLGNGRRAYDTILMRFHVPDPFSPFDRGGLNAYAYCQGDPVNNVDRDGYSITRVIGQVLGAITGTMGMFSSLNKSARHIVKRSEAAIKNAPIPLEFDARSRRNNAIIFNAGLVGTALKLPGVATAFGFPTASAGAEALTSAGIVTSLLAGAAKLDQLLFDAVKTIKTARELRLPPGALLRASLLEAGGWYLMRGEESPIIASKERVIEIRATFKQTPV
ncbi:RHS repeat-associated core domain-containing protein [Pseudomonas putida]|uniref:RHS repeat-associated core domain-containing protein n=1 Tax=Pseudomonas putida TaxID=303 RepID=UPI0034D62FA2